MYFLSRYDVSCFISIHFGNLFIWSLSLSDDVFIMIINVKMPTIVGILTFMSIMNCMLSSVEHEKSLFTSGPEAFVIRYL